MIYKFRLEIYLDDAETLVHAKSDESGNFWWAFTEFVSYLMAYARQHRLDRDE